MPTLDHAEHLMRRGAFQKAKRLLSEIIFDDPSDLRAICDIGIAYTETGENDKAIKALNHYIQNDSENPYAWEALGCAQLRSGKLAMARKSLIRALRIIPKNPSALRNLAILYSMEEKHSMSLELLQQSIRISPQDYRSLFALNFTFRDLGQREKRERILERLMEMKVPEKIGQEIALIRIRMSLKWE